MVLVRKTYPAARKALKTRTWRLKNLAKEKEEEALRGKSNMTASEEMDVEMFMRDIEEDGELRGMVNLYKDVRMGDRVVADEEEVEEDFPQINVDELLEDFEAMGLQDAEGDVVM